ncbi:P-loop containing nucleoside triphosphate hydrolase protein [Neofusicoccum parvum]|uniref:P-loop containing nucleoside triphosphate hydrolase protein n=1 Tax=Neofusicoccum parvum TaxID=310453 RepID=A0ACB5SM86_9PEZI|nr:P-loop containing nucleoside triphosphate hydrolase protein [Neofusicoccum parvum]
MENEGGQNIVSEYTIPEWFLKKNVKTNADLLKSEPELALVERAPKKDENQNKEEKQNQPARYEILQDEYAAIRLTTAAALIPNHKGELPEKTPSILFRTDERPEFAGAVDYLDHVVENLARDLGATLISVNLEDLEDLGREFDLQDTRKDEDRAAKRTAAKNQRRDSKVGEQSSEEEEGTKDQGTEQKSGEDKTEDEVEEEEEEEEEKKAEEDEQAPEPREQPDRKSFHSLAIFYFGVRCERKGTTEGLRRNKAAIYALLDSARIKQQQENTSEISTEQQDVSTQSTPVLLHFKDAKVLSEDRPSWRFLRRLANRVQERRKTGQQILVFASEVRDRSGSFGRMHEKFLINEYSTFHMVPPNASTDATFYKNNEIRYIKSTNVCQLKRLLRDSIPHAFDPELLTLDSADDIDEQWQQVVFPGKKAWSEDEVKRAAMQIIGQMWGKTSLNLDDVTAITSRMHRTRVADGLDSNHEDDTKSGGQNNALTLKNRLDKIEGDCNSYEKDLFRCVVDPEKLKTTYDDVIIDQETKDSVKQLIALSKLRPEAASYDLLRHIRVNGALFYGPPGTGKTLLCRAIANDSGSNMIALDPASIQAKYCGQSEKAIAAAFSLASKLSPCVLFIDEVDALFYRRSSGDKSWERSQLNQFLQEMDGLAKADKAPFVIVATNRPNDLDDAFLRRLPQKVLFTLPAAEERARIFRVFLKEEDMDPSVSIEKLANVTDGFSGSDIKNLCGHAALAWAMEQTEKENADGASAHLRLENRHFAKALMKSRPTVSDHSVKDLKEFARRFNPGDTEKIVSRTAKSSMDLRVQEMTNSYKHPVRTQE